VDGSDEDVHSFVERLLVERLGDTAKRLHTGRSRNEQVSLDLRLYVRRRIPVLQQAVAEVIRGLADQAKSADETQCPRTRIFARRSLSSWLIFSSATSPPCAATMMTRTRTREANALPLGSGAVAGTSYAVDVQALRRTWVSIASWPTASTRRRIADFAATFIYATAMTMVHLSRLAEESDHLLRRRASVLRVLRRAEHGQQHDAAEEKS